MESKYTKTSRKMEFIMVSYIFDLMADPFFRKISQTSDEAIVLGYWIPA
jgi:hypothetical protein